MSLCCLQLSVPATNLQKITIVHTSLAQLLPMRETAVALFHARLVALDPALPSQFEQMLPEHSRLFWHVLEQWINGLECPQTIIPQAKQLGCIHARLPIRPYHYHAFAQALLGTLAHLQGNDFTPDVAEAWAEAFCLLTGIMKEAACQQVPNQKVK